MVQIVKQTHDEKVEMYKKCTKLELIEMLINCNLHLESVTEQLHKLSIGGPRSDVRSEGEQLGNEGSAKSVREGNEMYALGYKAGFDKGYNIGLADGRA